MEPTRLQPPNMGGTKARALLQAKEMEKLVAERAKRSGDEPPPYEFFELIGKGAYGRVFKGKSRKSGGLVAIKVIDIDKVDYEEMTTKNLTETLKEIDILQQLRDSNARPYVNIIEEARSVHNELWIISEYASGGSVNTLMKPTMQIKNPGPGLPERFIIPIARELVLGLKYIHEAGVLHRDLKSNNVLILEDGRVQLCDFGVSNTLEPQKSKRSTIVGTPYWMAPELQREWVKDADPRNYTQPKEISYGNEVDIWAYGCTIYEMACGFPPHHRVVQWDLPTAGVPELEGDRFSAEIRDFLDSIFQIEARDRPNPDEILDHPFLADSLRTHPTSLLIKLVEEYYAWEIGGGSRQSLFNPYGAQAPDPLAPEPEDEDDEDWTFSTSEEFMQEHASQIDPFSVGIGMQPASSLSMPLADMGRFEQLQARFKEESIVRGQKRLNKLFDPNTTPYRYSAVDMSDSETSTGRPPSDLVLRDFNPGAPNRETVIDLDFSMPSVDDVPSIDLGEVPTIKANRVKSLLRQMEEEDRQLAEEERNQKAHEEDNDLTKRATKDWKFPSTTDDQANRKTMDWSFPAEPEVNRKTMDWSFPKEPEKDDRKTMDWKFPPPVPKLNRRTVEWTFDAAMAEANNEAPRNRMSRRQTKDWKYPRMDDNRATKDFAFSRQAQLEAIDDFPEIVSAPASPMRSSMIDLDMATVDTYKRPSTNEYESGAAQNESVDNPFNLEDQVQLSQNNQRASFHMKSQSEPNHAVHGLLTPQQFDNQGHLTLQSGRGSIMHARGVSSVSQVRDSTKSGIGHRPNQRSQQLWEGWSHNLAFGLNSDDTASPSMSVITDISIGEEDIDELWENFERYSLRTPRRFQSYTALRSSRRTDSTATTLTNNTSGVYNLDSDTDYPYSSDSTFEDGPVPNSYRKSTLSVGPNGKPLVDFPIPQGPDVQAMLTANMDSKVMEELLLKSVLRLRDGTKAARDLLRAMKLEEVEMLVSDGDTGVDEGMNDNTLRLWGAARRDT